MSGRKATHGAVLQVLAALVLMALAVPAVACGRQTGRLSARSVTVLVTPKGKHGIPAKRLAKLQAVVDASFVPTVPGAVTVRRGTTETLGCGAAGDHYIELNCLDGFSLLHELAHESQMFVGPGSVLWAGENFGAGAVGWSDEKIRTLARLLGGKPGGPRLAELSADAAAVCGLYGATWRRWWGHWRGKARPGWTRTWVSTPTPYDFRAGPEKYVKVCAALRMS